MDIVFFFSENALRIFFMLMALILGYLEGRGIGALVSVVCGGVLLKLIVEVSKHATGGISLSPEERTPEEQFRANETLLLVMSMFGASGGALFGGLVEIIVGLVLFVCLGYGFLWLVTSAEAGVERTTLLVIGSLIIAGLMVSVSYFQDQATQRSESRELLRDLQRNAALMKEVHKTSQTMQQKLERVRPMALSWIARREFQKAKDELAFLRLINLTMFVRLDPSPLRDKGMRKQGEIRVLLACIYAHQAAQSPSGDALLQESLRSLVMPERLALAPKGKWVRDCFPEKVRVQPRFVRALRGFGETATSRSSTREGTLRLPTSRSK
ncbi:MAG: hypothetical protein H6728_11750 [Myxococcales bacterium]|nr:hypothetical protein [Myxococcales bacterium]